MIFFFFFFFFFFFIFCLSYELQREGIPYTLITDSMAASLMRAGKINRVFLGADRICSNGTKGNFRDFLLTFECFR